MVDFWLSRDPIAERGGINLYGYVGNNPAALVDLLGLDAYFSFANGPTQTAATAEDFVRIASSAENGSITGLTVEGHAGGYFQGFNEKDNTDSQGLMAGGHGDVYVQDSEGTPIADLGELLKNKFAPRAGVQFKLGGCNVASGQGNITETVSKVVPNVLVSGSSSPNGPWYSPFWYGVGLFNRQLYFNGEAYNPPVEFVGP